jgi:hypothetical protein
MAPISLAEKRQHEGGVGEDARVVLRHLERLPSEIAGLAAGRLRRFGPAVSDELQVTDRRPGECSPVKPIDRDCTFEQSHSLVNALFRCRKADRKRAQIEVVGAEVGGRPRGGSAHLGGLQCWLDDAGDADRDLVLKVEDIFERAVEAVGPQMSAGGRVDQLPGDSHALPGFAHRAFST